MRQAKTGDILCTSLSIIYQLNFTKLLYFATRRAAFSLGRGSMSTQPHTAFVRVFQLVQAHSTSFYNNMETNEKYHFMRNNI